MRMIIKWAIMLILSMPGIMRGGQAASAPPSLIELPELIARWSGDDFDGDTLNGYVLSLTNGTGVTISGGAFVISSSQALYTEGYLHARRVALGRGDFTIGARVNLDSPIAGGFHTIMSWAGDVFRGVEFTFADNLLLKTSDPSGTITTVTGPAIDGGRWWSVVAQYSATTNKVKIHAIDDEGTITSTESSELTERDLYLFTDRLYLGNQSVDRALKGKMRDVFLAHSHWSEETILDWHNDGTPLTEYTVPNPDLPPEPWSNVSITENWLNTTTTGTPGIYWLRPWRMQSGQLRWFHSVDHGTPSTSPSVLTGTSANPITAPASWTGLSTPLDTTLAGPDGNYHVANAETPTYLYVAGDANARPHYLYVNYVCTSWPTQGGAPTAGLSDLEITVLFSSAAESFSSMTYEGVAFPGTVAEPSDFEWLGYARVYAGLPGTTGYHAYHLGNRHNNVSYFTKSSDPKLFPVGNADSVALDDCTCFPSQSTPAYWKENIFTPDGVNVYAVAHGSLIVLGQDDDGNWTRPTGVAWPLPFPASASPAQGWTAFWEANKLYVYRLLGFYPDDGFEQIDLMVCDFPGA